MGDPEPSAPGPDDQEKTPENRKRYSEIFRSLDAIEISLGSAAADVFMGDGDDQELDKDTEPSESCCKSQSSPEVQVQGDTTAQEADQALGGCCGGIEAALEYAKAWSKYVKELLAWMEKRLSYEAEFSKGLVKIAELGRNVIFQQHQMPLQALYTMVLEHDIRVGNSAMETVGLLQQKEFYQPLSAKKNEVEKWRKEFKDQWIKEQKRMNEALSSLRKSRLQYVQRCEELEKARLLSARAEDEFQSSGTSNPGSASKQLEKRRRSREEAQAKVQEAEALYRSCISDANFRRQELEKVRARIVSHVRKLIYQGDEVLTRVTLRMFKQRLSQSEQVPLAYQYLSEVCKPYRVGEKYLEFIQALQKKKLHLEVFEFEPFASGQRSPPSSSRKAAPHPSGSSPSAEDPSRRLLLPSGDHGASRPPGGDGEGHGGSESRSLDSPSSSPGTSGRKLSKAPSTGTVSSWDEFEERDSLQTFDAENGSSQQQLRNIPLSVAAQTHRLRRLRGPSKCRDCDTFMVSGFECEECYLACHKKCLENLLITCGHRRLPARAPLFGVDFSQVPRDFPEEIPSLVLRCTSEIEARALGVQGIYRVSGSKARVEKLCQAFESGRGLVDLSEHSPHDITGVLKHFLKELSAPVLLPQLYDQLMALAKDLQKPGEEKLDGATSPPDPTQSMRDLLGKLPGSNYNTLRHLIAHLYRVAEKYEENKMSPNNLGIVFGPTLIRPGSGSDISMSCLVDSGYQAQVVEFLIQNYERVFGMEDLPSAPGCESLPGEALGEKEEGAQSPDTAQTPAPESCSSQHRSDAARGPEPTPEGPPIPASPDSPGVALSLGAEPGDPAREKTDEGLDTSPAAQPRCHFSRQPVKYGRAAAKGRAALPKPPSTEPGAEGSPPAKGVPEESSGSGSSSRDTPSGGRQQLQHLGTPRESAGGASESGAEEPWGSPGASLESRAPPEPAHMGTYL